VFKNLSKLTSNPYSHRFYVDGSPTVGDAFGGFPSCSSGDCWRSILVSGLRAGGQGVFALDVTDPANQFSEGQANNLVLWEFTDADDADLGYTFSQPSIVRMRNMEWAAVVGNGYNNSEADGSVSTTGHAVLFILFLDEGMDDSTAWTHGADYVKLDTGAGSTGSPNGLATPAAVDVDGDYNIDYIYAGDLEGSVWRFDVTSANPADWLTVAPVKVFSGKSAAGDVQHMTSRLQVGAHPDKSQTGVIVYVGTGKYIEDADNTDTIPTQTFYAFWDKLEAAPTVVTRSVLQEQTILLESGGQRITSNNEVNWSGGQLGWFIDLPTAGERVVSNPVLRNERIIFTTLIPDVQICSFGGTSWLMEMNAFTGGRLEDSPFDLNDDKMFDDSDKVSVSINGSNELVSVSGLQSTEGILPTPTVLSAGRTEIKFNSGSKGGIFVTVENPGPKASGRIAWRQFQ
jgi:type IV pilus assembly protein PilY1